MIAASLVQTAQAHAITIATAESCTGGGLGFEITRVPGSSAVYQGGIIAYANRVKMATLDVPEAVLIAFGAVSEETCRAMVDGLARRIPSRLQLAISGVAGPGADGPKPEGRVCFALGLDGVISSFTQEFGALGRDHVRSAASAMIFGQALARIEAGRQHVPAI